MLFSQAPQERDLGSLLSQVFHAEGNRGGLRPNKAHVFPQLREGLDNDRDGGLGTLLNGLVAEMGEERSPEDWIRAQGPQGKDNLGHPGRKGKQFGLISAHVEPFVQPPLKEGVP